MCCEISCAIPAPVGLLLFLLYRSIHGRHENIATSHSVQYNIGHECSSSNGYRFQTRLVALKSQTCTGAADPVPSPQETLKNFLPLSRITGPFEEEKKWSKYVTLNKGWRSGRNSTVTWNNRLGLNTRDCSWVYSDQQNRCNVCINWLVCPISWEPVSQIL